ncbi:helix-turn-helix transcriptional regulator [Erwinia aphidicola]|nr:helix-turn-helix transcriptional regulator [Erwinia aphidicola]
MANLKELMAKRSPESQQRIIERTNELLIVTRLDQLREAAEASQTGVGKAMGITQPTVAAMEQRGAEIKVSTLKRYVEAIGGTLNVSIVLPNGKHLELTM